MEKLALHVLALPVSVASRHRSTVDELVCHHHMICPSLGVGGELVTPDERLNSNCSAFDVMYGQDVVGEIGRRLIIATLSYSHSCSPIVAPCCPFPILLLSCALPALLIDCPFPVLLLSVDPPDDEPLLLLLSIDPLACLIAVAGKINEINSKKPINWLFYSCSFY
jgi:hypothetical protein